MTRQSRSVPGWSAFLLLPGLLSSGLRAEAQPLGPARTLIELSRASSVEIFTANSSGTGFVIGDELVATAFHVVAALTSSEAGVKWALHPDLTVELPDGERLKATCVTLPSPADPAPLQYDFAILRLERRPRVRHPQVALADPAEKMAVGDEIVFSGFPLATPGMVTHKGMISGFDDTSAVIMLQAPINKGNSGGAVLNARGRVLGIISMREGGISKGLAELNAHIDSEGGGRVFIHGVNPLQSVRSIIQTLDRYISTGIGYAFSVKPLRAYVNSHPEVAKAPVP